MRTETPSIRWMARWQAAYVAAGGWAGPATLRAMAAKVATLYRAGATAKVVGIVMAEDFRLRSRLNTAEELAS